MKYWRVIQRLSKRILLVLCAALVIVAGPWAITKAGSIYYKKANYALSQTIWQVASDVSWYERDIPKADVGAALFSQSKFQLAAKSYEAAIALAPQSRVCNWRLGAALSYQRLAEASQQQGKSDEALTELNNGLRVISDNKCNDDQSKQTAKQITEQIKKSQKGSKKNGQKQGQQSSSDDAEKQLSDTSKQEQYQREMNQNQNYDQQQQKRDNGNINYDIAW